jgi:hypothetical protein
MKRYESVRFVPLHGDRPSRLRVEPAEFSISYFFAAVIRIMLRKHNSLQCHNIERDKTRSSIQIIDDRALLYVFNYRGSVRKPELRFLPCSPERRAQIHP